MLKSQKALDKRDKRLMHKIWLAAVAALEAQKKGHSNRWQDLQDAMDHAEDEMGPVHEYDPSL